MKLSDIMSHAGLTFYTEVALIIFMAVFIAIVVRTLWPSRKRTLNSDAQLPFDEGRVVAHSIKKEH